MKKALISAVKFILFFFGWLILAAVLPQPAADHPAIWRLWAEFLPLLALVVVTLLFWLIDKRKTPLCLASHPVRGILTGIPGGVLWLGMPAALMLLTGVMRPEGVHAVPLLAVWLLSAFLNVVMQEMLLRGYLYQMLKKRHNVLTAGIATTILFTLLHGGAFEAGLVPVLNVITMSWLMTLVLEYTGSLIAPVLMHFIWNGAGAILLGGVSLAEDYPHLLELSFTGSSLLSGGICKIEGSIFTLAINLLLIVAVSLLLRKNQRSQ